MLKMLQYIRWQYVKLRNSELDGCLYEKGPAIDKIN